MVSDEMEPQAVTNMELTRKLSDICLEWHKLGSHPRESLWKEIWKAYKMLFSNNVHVLQMVDNRVDWEVVSIRFQERLVLSRSQANGSLSIGGGSSLILVIMCCDCISNQHSLLRKVLKKDEVRFIHAESHTHN